MDCKKVENIIYDLLISNGNENWWDMTCLSIATSEFLCGKKISRYICVYKNVVQIVEIVDNDLNILHACSLMGNKKFKVYSKSLYCAPSSWKDMIPSSYVDLKDFMR